MFKKSTSHEANLSKVIDELIEKLGQHEVYSDEYATITKRIVELTELTNKSKVSRDTLALIGANFAGIILVLSHERTHVIATKAFSLVKKII